MNRHLKNQKKKSQKRNKKMTEKKVVRSIVDNYSDLAKSLVNQLTLSTPNHGLTTGNYREDIWKGLFEQIVPRKFCIDQNVFIIDSEGQISNEVDLAIFDEQYTPYIFKYGKIKFIPIEAVAVAIQCKSKNIDKVDEWADSIKKLKTSLDSVVRLVSDVVQNKLDKANGKKKAQTSTRPILILCSQSGSITKIAKDKFDIILNVFPKKDNNTEVGELIKIIPREEIDYKDWYMDLNHYKLDRYNQDAEKYVALVLDIGVDLDRQLSNLKVTDPDTGAENVILSLTFQLNQLLMLINNPMFFPHQAYVKMFQDNLNEIVDTAGAHSQQQNE